MAQPKAKNTRGMKPGEGLSLKKLDQGIKDVTKEMDDRLDLVEGSISDLTGAIREFMAKQALVEGLAKSAEAVEPKAKPEPIMARDNPHIIRKDGVHSEDVYQHLDEHDIEFVEKGPDFDLETTRPGLRSVLSAEFKEKAEQMMFDEEPVQIMVMPSQSTYPDHTFCVGVNGRMRMITRGKRQWLPRKYVEVLLRAKISTYGNFETRNPMTNELTVSNPETKSHRYPLQVIQDKNPLGARWLERVTNEINV